MSYYVLNTVTFSDSQIEYFFQLNVPLAYLEDSFGILK